MSPHGADLSCGRRSRAGAARNPAVDRISDLFEHKQLAPGEGMGPYGCCYLPDSVLNESDFVGLEQTKKMWMI